MATFTALNPRDFRSRREDFSETDNRCDFIQLACHARTARHPLAREPVRRFLLPDEIIPNEAGGYCIHDGPAYATWEAIRVEQRYTLASAHGITRTDLLHGIPIPSKFPRSILDQLDMPYPPLFSPRFVTSNFLAVHTSPERLDELYHYAVDRLLHLQMWNERAKFVAAKLVAQGEECD